MRDTGVGILLVEQNARQSLALADRGYLIENGKIVGSGTRRRCSPTRRCAGPISAESKSATKPLGNHGEETAMNKINLLLDNQDVQAIDGVTFERLNPMTGEVATRAAAAKVADVKRGGRRRRGGLSGMVGDRPERAPRDPAQGRRRAGGARRRNSSS